MKKVAVICAVVALFGGNYAVADWTTLSVPEASSTHPRCVDGDNVVGFYMTAASYPYDHGFVYNSTTETWLTLDKPGAIDTILTGVSGDRIVGTYQDNQGISHGLLYNIGSSTWTTLDMNDTTTWINAIDGDNIVGGYQGGNGAFVYNLATSLFTPLNMVGLTKVNPRGVSGNRIVGRYTDSLARQYGFIYNIADETWVNFSIPDSMLHSTTPWSIEGDNIVGGYVDADNIMHGFIYNITGSAQAIAGPPNASAAATWVTIDAPNASATVVYGISGNTLVGTFQPRTFGFNVAAVSSEQGFIYTIPEPTTICILAFGGILLLHRKK
ncbi:MAG: hypothetical protein WC845_03560 [Candidatus Staskawiczbacteria bacterium]|jgi:hypothetical protein